MTTATPRARINAGAWQYGGITGLAVDDVVTFGRDTTDGVQAEKYEIFSYPPDFALPSGWSDVAGVYTYSGAMPDDVTLTYWGKYLVRLTLTTASGVYVTSEELGLSIASVGELEECAEGEDLQFGGWASAYRRDLRRLAGGNILVAQTPTHVEIDPDSTWHTVLDVEPEAVGIVVNGMSVGLDIEIWIWSAGAPPAAVEDLGLIRAVISRLDGGGVALFATEKQTPPLTGNITMQIVNTGVSTIQIQVKNTGLPVSLYVKAYMRVTTPAYYL